ncbi:MAG: serine/threonine-protein kinase [Cyanobacteria bacterium P01_F01_bin.42]
MLLFHYELLERLGAGQYGKVYRGRCLKTQKTVAIKQLSLDMISTHRFIREVDALSWARHPNLVSLLGIEYDLSGRYLILDYCDRGTFQDVLDEPGSLSLGLKLQLVMDILRGLKHLHHSGICHCDLKPQNIFLSQGEHRIYARIGDFGSALASNVLINRHSLEYNANPGSPAYMAPERFYGEPSYAADLYSVGIILYELLVGDRPFLGHIGDLTRGHLSESIEVPQEIPALFRSFIYRALQKLPQKRFQSAEEMLRLCEMIATNVTQEAMLTGTPLLHLP